jgi:hypothetical protein
MIAKSGMRSGSVGLHVTALEALFRWIEEVKLWQISGQFHDARARASDEDVDLATSLPVRRQIRQPASELPLSKAA